MSINIKDRVAVGDDKYIIEQLSDGRARLTPAPDSVAEEGTPINKALLQPLFDNTLTFRRILTASDDLNDITESGVYAYSTASMPKNAPFENAAVVEVFGSTNANSQKIQRAYRYGAAGYSAFRPYYDKDWLAWKKSPTHYLLTASNVNEIPKFNGGQTVAQLYDDIANGNPVTVEIAIVSQETGIAARIFLYPQEGISWGAEPGQFVLASPSVSSTIYYMTISREQILQFVAEPFLDYVIEEGNSKGWNYRKWYSGKMEAWGIQTVTIKAKLEGNPPIVGLGGYLSKPTGMKTVESAVGNPCTHWSEIGAKLKPPVTGATIDTHIYGLAGSYFDGKSVGGTFDIDVFVIGTT